jgi:hypothetical protein
MSSFARHAKVIGLGIGIPAIVAIGVGYALEWTFPQGASLFLSSVLFCHWLYNYFDTDRIDLLDRRTWGFLVFCVFIAVLVLSFIVLPRQGMSEATQHASGETVVIDLQPLRTPRLLSMIIAGLPAGPYLAFLAAGLLGSWARDTTD